MKQLALASVALIVGAFAAFASPSTDRAFDIQPPPFVELMAVDDVGLSNLQAIALLAEAVATGDMHMHIAHIEGATRTIGKTQGYLGLPIRDVRINCTVNGEDTPAMVTAWHPTPDELQALMKGAPVYVQLLGQSHPPIMVGTGPEPDPV